MGSNSHFRLFTNSSNSNNAFYHVRKTQSCCCSLPAPQCISEFLSSFLNLSSFFFFLVFLSPPPQIFFLPVIFRFSHLTEESCLDCRSSCALLGILVWDTDVKQSDWNQQLWVLSFSPKRWKLFLYLKAQAFLMHPLLNRGHNDARLCNESWVKKQVLERKFPLSAQVEVHIQSVLKVLCNRNSVAGKETCSH